MTMTPLEKVKYVRATSHYTPMAFVERIFDRFIELHGNRCGGDDGAIVSGIGWIKEMPIFIIAIEKGRCSKERIERNFGCPSPEGYRKAKRIMKLAEKFHRPILCLIDTIGASCNVKAEENGQAQAIAECLKTMVAIKVPTISIVTGEAESGGALALAVSNEVWMMENAIYSVITPESCSLIIWDTDNMCEVAANALGITADDAYQKGVIDQIISEDAEINIICKKLKIKIYNKIKTLYKYEVDDLVIERFNKFRNIDKIDNII